MLVGRLRCGICDAKATKAHWQGHEFTLSIVESILECKGRQKMMSNCLLQRLEEVANVCYGPGQEYPFVHETMGECSIWVG